MGKTTPPAAATVQDHLKQVWQARAQGDRAGVEKHLALARACHPNTTIAAVGMLEAELLLDDGYAAIGRSMLQVLAKAYPENPWPLRRLAILARDSGDLTATGQFLTAAIGRDPDCKVPELRKLQAEQKIDAGQEAEARRLIAGFAPHFTWLPGLYWRLAQMAKARNDPVAALEHLQAGLAVLPDNHQIQIACARIEADSGDFDAVIARLEPLAAGPDVGLDLLIPLLWAYRARRQTTNEVKILDLALEIAPLDPRILRYFFTHHVNKADPALLDRALRALPDRVGPDQANELSHQALLKNLRFSEALASLRQRSRSAGQRNPEEACQLIEALFGAQKVLLGLRYLGACMRRWPEHAKLIWIYVTNALKLGRFAEAETAIQDAARHLPQATILQFRFRLHACRIDLKAAIEVYARLRAIGKTDNEMRDVLAKLIYTSLDPAEFRDIYDRIGFPADEDDRLLHRAGLAGLMTMEFEMEREAYALADGFGGLEGWVQARAESPVPAIRLIDAWRAGAGQATRAAAPEIPRRIFQYWDALKPPRAVQDMLASWARAPGFEHLAMDRTAALKFLREEFGADWGRAFLQAQDAAQGSDLLRLCLLVRRGGIWADADDYLYGDLDAVLGGRGGLILYREPSGGAIGNNFIAAAPGHPVLDYAARLACRALLQRQHEAAWNKTGPGVLTRALGQYLVQADQAQARSQITILDLPQVAGNVAMHNQVHYKATPVYWEASQARAYPFKLWPKLVAALEGAADLPAAPGSVTAG